MINNTVVILAAGKSERFKKNKNKVLYPLLGKPIYQYSLDLFLNIGFNVVIVANPNDLHYFENLPENVIVVGGGNTRTQSVKNGLDFVNSEFVYIHDAARPLINIGLINQLIKKLSNYDAAYISSPIRNAIKTKDTSQTILKTNFHFSETPQAFRTSKLKNAYYLLPENISYDDDISVYKNIFPEESIGIVENLDENLKLTYSQDIKTLENLLCENDYRIGHSFDLHRLEENLPLLIGGIVIPSNKGEVAHSDGDCLLHAMAESLLGSLSLGDLGKYFPDTDETTRGISSTIIIQKSLKLIEEKGYGVINFDTMVYLEKPKLSRYIEKIIENISQITGISTDRISIKATTYEGIEAIGKGEAIACESTVLIRRIY
ncbi:MAG: 2-C-methyl-D-erythritol 2,4-cyclodiphosphate synthase [Acholeplasmatales bacterium]|jgi:2-C-methyl-D-erythritol 2,4-cyclodiphosphate synthase/2-C-methyl-D-erythritol 4-phosphate cytidylyltransferase|nr:2-C-methyl-D-erythritol 2,4-cyclodiphosphate synthase [Acholeplasmatales bacterium]